MGFLLHSMDNGHVPSFEYLPGEGLVPKAGMPLVLTDGRLAAATGSTMPEYISMAEGDSPCEAGAMVPVIKINENMIFETTAAESLASIKVGDRVALSENGTQLTAAKGGPAQVLYIEDQAIGGGVRVRFIRQ